MEPTKEQENDANLMETEPVEKMQEENGEDELNDDTPEFINNDDVVEVQVDEENIPMDDDEDEVPLDATEEEKPTVVDMSRNKLESHRGPVYAVSSYCNPTTQQLSIVSGGGDDKAYLHHISTFTDTKLLQYAHTDSVSSVALNLQFLPADATDTTKNPRLVAVGAYDGAIILYNADSGELVKQLEGPTDVEWIRFHPKGGTVLLVGSAADGTVWMYHMLASMNYKCLQVFVGHESSVTDGDFSPDGKWAVTCSADGTVRIWAPRTGLCKHVFRFNNSQQAGLTVMCMNGGTDGQLVLVGGEDGFAHVCHLGTKRVVASLRHFEIPTGSTNDDEVELPMSVEAVGFAPSNPNWCATGGVDGVLKIWDLSIGGGQCRQTCRPPNQQQLSVEKQTSSGFGGITRLKWHPSLPFIFTASTAGSIHLWDARNGKLLHTLTGNTEVVNDMDIHFLNEGMHAVVVSASDDNCVRIHDIDISSIIQ